MSAIIARIIALFLAHRTPESPRVPVQHMPATRTIYGETVDADHDEDDHEDDEFEHNSEECEAW